MKGEVVGIAVAGLRGATGINFAVPINTAKPILAAPRDVGVSTLRTDPLIRPDKGIGPVSLGHSLDSVPLLMGRRYDGLRRAEPGGDEQLYHWRIRRSPSNLELWGYLSVATDLFDDRVTKVITSIS